jgi:hypothetical protein
MSTIMRSECYTIMCKFSVKTTLKDIDVTVITRGYKTADST